MQTEHLVDQTTIQQEQAAQVRRTAGATETKLSQAGHDAPATLPPSATDGTGEQTYQQWLAVRKAFMEGYLYSWREFHQRVTALGVDQIELHADGYANKIVKL
jgi:pyruvate/2-oxoglutarate dehydrogenase complex dihydrolipoamide acyltransferase (E2) component